MLLRFDRWNIDNDLPGRHQETHPKLLVKVCNPTVLGPNHAQGHPKYHTYTDIYIYILHKYIYIYYGTMVSAGGGTEHICIYIYIWYTSWILMYDVSVNVWDLPLAPNHIKSPNSPTSQKSSLLAFDRKIGFFLFENTYRESFLNPNNATVTSTFLKKKTIHCCLVCSPKPG